MGKPGWWLPYEGVSSDPVPCVQPATARCPGHDVSVSSSGCGEGYSATGYACSDCAAGYYPDDSLRCVACPAGGLGASVMLPLLMMAGVGVGVLLVTWGIAHSCSRGLHWKQTAGMSAHSSESEPEPELRGAGPASAGAKRPAPGPRRTSGGLVEHALAE